MVTYPLHRTLYYGPTSTDEMYTKIWADFMEGKILNIETGNFMMGSRGLQQKLNCVIGKSNGIEEETRYHMCH